MFNYIVRRNGNLIVFATPPEIRHYQQALDKYKRLFTVNDELIAILRSNDVEISQSFEKIRIEVV